MPLPALRDLAALAFEDPVRDHDTPQGRLGRLVLAQTRRALVGYAIATPVLAGRPGDWYLHTVAVTPDRQGEGIGHHVVYGVAQWLAADGAASLAASAMYGVDQPRRRLWLRDIGFTPYPNRRSFLAHPTDILPPGARQPHRQRRHRDAHHRHC